MRLKLEVGTLKEIGACDGDKVLCIDNTIDLEDGSEYSSFLPGREYTYRSSGMAGESGSVWPGDAPYLGEWRILSTADTPTGPVRTVTRTTKEIVPGVYGAVRVDQTCYGKVAKLSLQCANTAELRAAIATLTEIADALESSQ